MKTSKNAENQHLLNRFLIWCQWSEMIIRVEKYSTFGIRKTLTKSVQYLPKLLINNKLIPTTEIGESFRYSGKYFDFGMSDKKHKEELITLLEDIMADIDLKPLHPKNKILLYSRYLLSKLSWHFTVAFLLKTWVAENIDSVVNKYIRKCLEIPVSGTLSNVYLANNKFGLNIYPSSIKFAQCQTVARNALKTSPNASIKNLWKETSDSKNIQYDVYSTTKEILKSFNSQQQIKLQSHLVVQGSFFLNVIKFSLKKLNSLWSKSQSNLPKNIYNFTIRCINNSLPTRRNLTKWGIMSNSDRSFCLKPETLLHVVAGCQSYLPRFRGGSRPMQPMRMHRSEFHVNLITRSRVSIETPKNNKIHNLISKCMSVVSREALLWYYRSKAMNIFEMISNELKFGDHCVCVFFIVLLSLYI